MEERFGACRGCGARSHCLNKEGEQAQRRPFQPVVPFNLGHITCTRDIYVQIEADIKQVITIDTVNHDVLKPHVRPGSISRGDDGDQQRDCDQGGHYQ